MAEITAANIEAALKKQLDALNTTVDTREVGTVIQVGDGIARVEACATPWRANSSSS